MSKRRVAILISGRGSNMESLIAAARASDFPAEIALVLSNRPDAPGLASAKAQGIATAAVDHKIHAGREAFEASMQKMLEAHRIDFICLAGFMRLLTASFVTHWAGRIINIHPAILPAFTGLHTHERALKEGVKLHGCTVHFVVPEMDAGPIIAQAAVSVQTVCGRSSRAPCAPIRSSSVRPCLVRTPMLTVPGSPGTTHGVGT